MDHLSTLTLHQLRYGELSLDQEREVRGHLEDCARCAGLLAQQEAQRHEFELLPVPDAIRRASRPSPWRRVAAALTSWQGGLALAAAALLAFVLVGQGGPGSMSDATGSRDATGQDTIRYKNAGTVDVLVDGKGRLEAGQTLSAGDRVQLQVAPGDWRHAWATDGKAFWAPFALAAGKATLSPFGLTLDDSTGDEAVILVLSVERLDEAEARAAVSGSAAEGIEVVTVTLPRAD